MQPQIRVRKMRKQGRHHGRSTDGTCQTYYDEAIRNARAADHPAPEHSERPESEIPMIICTSSIIIAREELIHAEHAGDAAVIRHVTTQEDGAAVRWTTVHDTPASALTELDRIERGAGNYARDRFVHIEIGTAFALLRNHVTDSPT